MRGVPSTWGMILSRKLDAAIEALTAVRSARLVLVAHGAVGDTQRTIVEFTDQRVDFRPQARLGQLLGKAPQFAAAGDGRMVVEEHAVGIAALAPLEGNRDDLAALGVIAEAGRVRHADELELHQRRRDLERLGHELAQLCGIGAVGDDQIFAIDRIDRGRSDRPGSSAASQTLGPSRHSLSSRIVLSRHQPKSRDRRR